MSTSSRRQFLRADFRGREPDLLPPWAVADFHDRCDGCGDCIRICHWQMLEAGPAGKARLKPNTDGCDLCGDCLQVCERGALSDAVDPPLPWTAVLESGCLLEQGIHCRRCEDLCASGAIHYLPALRMGRIHIDGQRCSGCTACVAACPEQVIRLMPRVTGSASP